MGTAQAKNGNHHYTGELNSALQAEFGCNNVKAAMVRATQVKRYWLAISKSFVRFNSVLSKAAQYTNKT